MLLATEEWAAQRNLPVLAYLRYGKAWAVDFASGKEGLLMAPAYAVPAMLRGCRADAAGLRLLRDSRGVRGAGALHAEGVGVAGILPRRAGPVRRRWAASTAPGSTSRAAASRSAIPFAATGTRIVATLAKLLAGDPSAKRGLISVCTAGGMGVTAILENRSSARCAHCSRVQD